jgi:hypothetical protein
MLCTTVLSFKMLGTTVHNLKMLGTTVHNLKMLGTTVHNLKQNTANTIKVLILFIIATCFDRCGSSSD